ncbi:MULTISPECIES: hypothetical protein [unclassified Kribbella]|uniref:hypothetical protein n=1 Tax=unclassified Kribbella TaxID=2644121 RepID=UPI0033F43845
MSAGEPYSGRLGAVIPPGTPEYALVARVVEAVARRTGMPSQWNRRLYEQVGGEHPGFAQIGGPIAVDRPTVLEPLVRAGADPVLARYAMIVLVHEAEHQTSVLGNDRSPDAVELASPEDTALEEARAVVMSARHTDEIIRETGLDREVPGILDAQVDWGYPGVSRCLWESVGALSVLTDVPADEFWTTIDKTPRPQRFNALADLVIDKRLGVVMPESHRALMRHRLTRSLRSELGALLQYEGPERPGRPTPEETSRFGAEHAQRAIADLSEHLADAEAHYAAHPGSEPPLPSLSPHEQGFLASLKAYQAMQQVQATIAELKRFLGSETGQGTTGMPQTLPAATVEPAGKSAEAGAGLGRGAGPAGGAGAGAGPGGGAATGGAAATGAAAAPGAAAAGRLVQFRPRQERGPAVD